MKTSVEIAADTKKLDRDLKQAEGKVRKSTKEMERAAGSVQGKFGEVGKGIEESTAGVRKFTGALSSVAGAFTGILGVIGLVSAAIFGLIKGANALGKALGVSARELKDSEKAARGVAGFIQDIRDSELSDEEIRRRAFERSREIVDQEQLAKLIEEEAELRLKSQGGGGPLFPLRNEDLERLREIGREIEQLRAKQQRVVDAAEREIELRQKARDLLKDKLDLAEAISIAEEERLRSLTDQERLIEEFARRRKILEREGFRDALDLLDEREARELEALRKREAEQKRLEEERKKREIELEEEKRKREEEARQRKLEQEERDELSRRDRETGGFGVERFGLADTTDPVLARLTEQTNELLRQIFSKGGGLA